MGLLYGTWRAILGGAASTYIDKVVGYGPIAYWPLNETVGVTAVCQIDSPAQDGTYSGPTLANDTAPDGSPAPYFDGVNDVVDIYSVPFRDAFNGATGASMFWIKADPACWGPDGQSRRPLMLRENGWNNYVGFLKLPAANTLQAYYRAGAVTDTVNYNTTRVDWFNMIFVWDKPSDAATLYINGSSVGSAGTLGVWGGVLHTVHTVIGSISTTGADWWHGWMSHVAIWDRVLAPGEVTDLVAV